MSTLWWIVVLWLACSVSCLGGFALHAELALRREMLEAADGRRWGHERTSGAIDFDRKPVGQ